MIKEPRTVAILYDLMDAEYSWRIKELSNFRNSIPREKNDIQKSLIRAGVTLLYAHWEGFVKQVANLYYQYVSFQIHNICEFRSSFIAILLSAEASMVLDGKKITQQTQMFEKIIEDLDKRAFLPGTHPIRTSNLKYAVFEDVCMLLNIDLKKFVLKEEFINKHLVEKRNSIAHGKYLDIEYLEFNESYRNTVSLLRDFKDEVTNSAALKKYLRDAKTTV